MDTDNKVTDNILSMDVDGQAGRYIEAGDGMQKNGDFNKAVENYSAAIEIDPNNSQAYYKRGWSKAYMGEISGEIEDWTKVIELDPSFAQVYADRAAARVVLRDYEGALGDINKAAELNPKMKNALRNFRNNVTQELNTKQSLEVDNSGSDLTASKFEKSIGSGPGRRDFLKQISVVGGAAAISLTLSGCGTTPAKAGSGKRWGMIIDLNKCIGCKACTIACKAENHTPPGVAYNLVLEKETGKFPFVKKSFISRPCMQCENSTCSKVCPVKATVHREDGIVTVDYDKCIGCRYCIAACPYGARSYDYGHNYTVDISNPWEKQASPEYGQKRKRTKGGSPVGNVRKCTFCLHRITNGIAPACASTCVGNAIYFGDMNDPEGKCMVHGKNLQQLLASGNSMRLKEEIGNEPRVYYLT